MSCTEAHSRTEWYSWPPVNRFGVGRPIALSCEPSVPPRIGVRTGAIPPASSARPAPGPTAGGPDVGARLQPVAHVRVLRPHLDLQPRARLGRDDLLGGAPQQLD